MSADDVMAAVGQLGDNSLAPISVDLSGLDLDAGRRAQGRLISGFVHVFFGGGDSAPFSRHVRELLMYRSAAMCYLSVSWCE